MIMDQFEIFAADIDYGTDYLNIMETTRFLTEPDLAWNDAQDNFQFKFSKNLPLLGNLPQILDFLKVAYLVLC